MESTQTKKHYKHWGRQITGFDTIHQVPVVQTLDSAIHPINFYPADNAIVCRGLSRAYCYPRFEQQGAGVQTSRLPYLSFPAPATFLLASSHLRNIRHRSVISSLFHPFQNFHFLPFPRPASRNPPTLCPPSHWTTLFSIQIVARNSLLYPLISIWCCRNHTEQFVHNP